MDDLAGAMQVALGLIGGGDSELLAIVLLSLRVSLTACIIAFVIGAPLGAALAFTRMPGRTLAIVLANALLGLPPVVVGLAVYMAFSRAGLFGSLGILFTPAAMVVAQAILCTPIVVALTHRICEPLWKGYGDSLMVMGAPPLRALATVLNMGREALITVFLAAFGRAIAEVGAIIIVGGNIRGFTRTMTTAIALETSKGDLPLALGLGIVLLSLSLAVSAAGVFFGRRVLS